MEGVEEMKEFTVYTYYHPKEEDGHREMVFAYTTYDRPAPHQKIYKIVAENGTKAKAIAIKMRREEERRNHA
jgi:hypothetical protein